jgi:uncharacterized membrane protein YgcG
MRRSPILALLLILATMALAPGLASAQEPTGPVECGVYEGVVCVGWFTDEPGVVPDPQRVEDAIDRLVGRYGNDIAFVIVTDSRGQDPLDFAANLGNAWGVGDAERDDGIVVLVDLDARLTVIVTGPGVTIPEDSVAGAADSFFGVGDFEGGALAIVGSLEQALAAFHGVAAEPELAPVADDSDDSSGSGWVVLAGLVGAAAIGGGLAVRQNARKRDRRETKRREELIDGDLEKLEPAGHELALLTDFAVPFAGDAPPTTTGDAVRSLRAIAEGRDPGDLPDLEAVWAEGLVVIIDRDRLLTETAEPLELLASGERELLEGALQQATRDALAVDWKKPEVFDVKRSELDRVITSLRPHRVAAARRRTAETIAAHLVATRLGWMAPTDAGERFVQSAAALDHEATLSASLSELESVYARAREKTDRLETLYGKLPSSTTRPAVAAALADLETSVDTSYEDYERVRIELESAGDVLARDGLDIPAIAALLLMNNDQADVDEFIDAYRLNRGRGSEPDESVEYALAGLQEPGEIERVRREADRLGLPVAITTALLRRRDDGPEVYAVLRDQLAEHDVTGDSRKTIAGILAISLEPAQAIRRWVEAREALAAMGLQGSYADVAAAFGASDPRGARVFALSYAAQRQALARSTIDDADRFAPELAHEGTRDQTDTWTGQPIPRGLYNFDPFTLLFYHWVITKGHHGSYGWEPIYRDQSWSQDRGSWWSGAGGFGGWGGGGGFSGGGGSSWGGGSWGGGGFGGFGGGGGFSGGGGSGW